MKIVKWLQLAAVIVVAVILFYGVYRGIHGGILTAKGDAVFSNAKAITRAFSYFHDDQGRYPSPDEVQDKSLMSVYLTNYPPVVIAGGTCNVNFGYHTLDYKSYEFHFCLPASSGGFKAGLNIVKSQ